MTEEELEIQIREEKDEEAKKAYTEMLQSCEDEPVDYLWFIPWKIILQENEKAIGNAAFKGPQNKGIVEISFSILPSLQKQGYMTEALSALVDWAFKQRDVYGITAETAPGNKASQRVLERNGFVMYANGQDGPRYKILKRRFFKTPIIAGVLLVAGILLGYFIPEFNLLLSIGIFTGVGAIFGIIVDVAAENRRKRTIG
ncbi:MAG: GNAT family N-acetyltransferase [Lachnospiraceae bacterium]|nr:GNAT family N-acetyltransferase [Lachnospiraceae bacterium]